ncbi:MAG: L-threonylcarbamoyladenylate synthase [Patescibacteria group bacterium]|nr:L-threonylcarbamoyladenylate synthase [Patescibacteria group bacterium]
MNNQIEEAIRILNQGGIVIFPTDTAFGIGCRIDDENAVRKLFSIRKRPENQAVPVLFNNIETIKNYLIDIPSEVEDKLIKKYWPGALTIILPCKTDKVPKLVRGGGRNLGIRIPNHKIILEIISKTGTGILGPSANFHGEKTPYRFEDLDPKLIAVVDYVVKGECKGEKASTVIDCSVFPWTIVRQGAIEVNL